MRTKRNFRNITAILLTAILAVFLFPTFLSATAAEPVSVDVYLLLGQSNAAGTSKITSSLDADLDETYDNILVGGACQPSINGNVSNFKILDYESLRPAAKGLGVNSQNIGPELGMARTLSSHYTAQNKAIIFKYASGSTNLLNDINDSNSSDRNYGNWYPRSLQNPSASDYVAGVTGGMYNGLITAFTTFTQNLANSGYAPKICGIAWMQGEDDRGSVAEYRSVIQTFVSDLREDLGAITDSDCSDAFFAIGEISETFRTSTQREANLAFIEMQNEVVSALMPAATVETGDLPINLPYSELAKYGYVAGVNATANDSGDYYVGSDRYHWNAHDMLTLGSRFADAFLENTGKIFVRTSYNEGGVVTTDKNFVNSGESITFSVRPDSGYKLASFIVGGLDRTAELANGTLTIVVSERTTAVAQFAALAQYTITIEGKYLVNKSTRKVYEGETAYVVPSPPDGQSVDTVKINGENMTYVPERDRYEFSPITADSTIVITYKSATAEPENEGGGCKKADASVVFAIIGALASVIILKRR